VIGSVPEGAACFGSGTVNRRVAGIFKAFERWASESDDRVRLVIILVWASFGMLVLISTLVAAWILLPPEYHLF
jgi:hypothetical protein